MSNAFFWLVTVAIFLAQGAIIATALRMHVAGKPSSGVLGSRPFEIFWTLLPLTLIVLVVFFSYEVHRANHSVDVETSMIHVPVQSIVHD